MGDKRYPSSAVTFIQSNKPSGNMFNPYNWGGYLIWHLYPEYKVFIDGRTLNETAFLHGGFIFRAEQGNNPHTPLWKQLLDAYGVNFILTKAVSSSGKIIPLVDVLYKDDAWKLIYADGKSMVFLRYAPENYSIINRYELSKETIHDEIIDECNQGIKDTPATKGYYETLGYMYMKKDRLEDALIMFQKYLTIDPNDEKVNYYHDLVKQYMKRYKLKHQ
jgi:tetratricopeptide (TPR) repeat protein